MGTLYRNGIPYVGSGGAGGVEVTQAEYDALPTSEKMNGSIYFITDGSVSYPTASQMRYDNTESQIPATSVQGAIDENRIEINDLKEGLSQSEYYDVTTVVNTIIRFRKIGKLVVAYHNGNFAVGSADTLYTIAVIPDDYCPIDDVYVSCVLVNSSHIVGTARVHFDADNKRVHIYSSLAGMQEYRFSIAYYIN